MTVFEIIIGASTPGNGAVFAAVITGSCTVLATLLVVYNEDLRNILSRGARKVETDWKGKGKDVDPPGLPPHKFPEDYEFDFWVKQKGKRLTGTCLARGEVTYRLKFEGSVQGDFVQLNYELVDDNSNGGGVMLLELLGSGKKMSGCFLGKRQREHGVSFGTLELETN